MKHLASFHSYFYEHIAAIEYARKAAFYEGKRYRVERKHGYDLFRWYVVATDIDLIALEPCS